MTHLILFLILPVAAVSVLGVRFYRVWFEARRIWLTEMSTGERIRAYCGDPCLWQRIRELALDVGFSLAASYIMLVFGGMTLAPAGFLVGLMLSAALSRQHRLDARIERAIRERGRIPRARPRPEPKLPSWRSPEAYR